VDITIQDPKVSLDGIKGLLKTPCGDIHFHTSLLGGFNLHNIMASAGAAICLDIPPEYIQTGLENITTVPGRMERVWKKIDFTGLVDYADTPDALKQVLSSLKELVSRRIITVFGCGGDRDRSKRPSMGEISGLFSDLVIITSDNPRSERPEKIISEIEAGIKKTGLKKISSSDQYKGYLTIVDRSEAIQMALRMAQRGDIVLVAGKGHEDYQILGTQKIAFDDRKKIEEILEK
jgi:UDP-N-acetylmuramoyl-L-alanyl-D-glutamate--2,6-diaminopimelate ligase